MSKYKKKPIIVEANIWYKYGDHKKVLSCPDSGAKCEICGDWIKNHGWINTLEGGHIVCPGDYIIQGIQNEFYPCKPDIFLATYEKC